MSAGVGVRAAPWGDDKIMGGMEGRVCSVTLPAERADDVRTGSPDAWSLETTRTPRIALAFRSETTRVPKRWARIATILLAIRGAGAARATTVEPMSVPIAADYAGQVMVGTVGSVRSYWVDAPRRIESEILWEGVEYLKGAPTTSDGTFRLVVQGGILGTRQMRIAGAPEFRPGERWLLFLLPTYKTHPVVGVHQYALRIVDDRGVSRVLTADGEPITGLDANGFLASVSEDGSHDHADVASVEPRAPRAKELRDVRLAVPVDEFVATLRPILAASRRHDLKEPAGKPVIGELTPEPLGSSPRTGSPSPSRRPRSPLPPREDLTRPSPGAAPK